MKLEIKTNNLPDEFDVYNNIPIVVRHKLSPIDNCLRIIVYDITDDMFKAYSLSTGQLLGESNEHDLRILINTGVYIPVKAKLIIGGED